VASFGLIIEIKKVGRMIENRPKSGTLHDGHLRFPSTAAAAFPRLRTMPRGFTARVGAPAPEFAASLAAPAAAERAGAT
jgi:hypothetical protein